VAIFESPAAPLSAGIVAAASATIRLADFAPYRKGPPLVPGVDLPGHFLKHADEQTITALAAVRQALAQSGLTPADMTGWGVVAAPRFIGRLAGAEVLDKFPRSGNSGVPAYQVAQNSLHSVSGAASIALGLHGPNVGIGGGPWSVAEGLTTALSLFDPALVPGLWLLMSQFDPEPIPDAQGNPQNNPLCYAVAIALDWRAATPGRLSLALDGPLARGGKSPWPEPTVPELAACIDAASRGLPTRWQCRLPWGGRIEMKLPAAARSHTFDLPAAA
jgi:hypothetical protein